MSERITDTHVFFWSGVLSNWHPCKFRYKGITFFNTEQAFMWEKAVFFGDMPMAEKILKTPEPRENKALGRKIKGFNTDRWLKVCYQVMVDVNFAKYDQNLILKNTLFLTEDKTIVEASPVDLIWGIGIHWKDDACLDEVNWKGMNLLGKALMEVRETLKKK